MSGSEQVIAAASEMNEAIQDEELGRELTKVNISKSVTVVQDGSDELKTPSKSFSMQKLAAIRPILKSKSMMAAYTRSESSIYPSYTNLGLPSSVLCRLRYQNTIRMHQKQFIKELKLHERLQPYALDGLRLRREFCNPVIAKVDAKDIITLTLQEERRLEYLLQTDPKEL